MQVSKFGRSPRQVGLNARAWTLALRPSRRMSELLEPRRLLAGHSAVGDALTVPQYSSHPGAPVTLFIDFDGNSTFSWTNNEGTFNVHGPAGTTDPVPAFDLDKDATTFNTEELSEINQIWAWTSEKYSPFNVNVTTVDPGNRDDNKTVQCIVGGNEFDWYGKNSGGVAAIGGFSSGLSNTCFCFSADAKNLTNPAAYRVHYMGDTVAHEAGHEFGLLHERTPGATATAPPTEYYPGTATRAPIMGGSSNNQTPRGIWWKTNNFSGQNSPDAVQDELAVLTSNAGHPFAYRGDDRAGPGVLFMTSDGRVSPAVTGLIEQTSDTDSFSFSAATNRATFTVNNYALGGMLAPKIRIYNASGVTVSETVTLNNTSATVSTDSLIGGQTYYVEIGSQGSYGDIGQFAITGSLQTFASYDPIYRFINVGGLSGNNNLTLTVINDGTTQGALQISDSINGGTPNIQTFQMAGLNYINVTLAAGNDTLTVRPLHTLNGLRGPGVRFDGAGGSDTLRVDAYTDTGNAFNVNSDVELEMGVTDVSFFGLEAVQLIGHTTVGNAFNVHYFTSVVPLTINAGSGNDAITVDADVLANAGGSFTFNGGGGTDTMTLNGAGLNTNRVFNVFDGFLNTFPDTGGGQRDYNWNSIETLNLYGGNGNDYADVYSLGATTDLRFYGNAGDDYLELGDPYDLVDLSSIFGVTRFSGGIGTDTLRYSDQAGDTTRTYTVANGLFDTSLSGPTYFDADIESLNIEGGGVGSTYNVSGGNFNPLLTLNGGGGSDNFVFTASTWNANVNAGAGGVDSMTVDDRTLVTYVPFRADLFPASYQRRWGSASLYTPYTINYTGVDSPTFLTAAATTTINIAGTAPTALGYQYTVYANSGNDSITLFPHDGAGNGTVLGPLGISGGGGTDTVTLDDSTQSLAQAYRFYNQYGPTTQNVGGVGAGGVGVGNDAEKLVINAGSGNDTFTIDSYQNGSGLALYGNGGDDRVDITPTSKNVQGYVTSIASFSFDGGAGTGDGLRLFNDASTAAWSYVPFGTLLTATNGAYVLALAALNVESMYASAGSGLDTFNVRGVSPGQTVELDGKGGNDIYTIGNTSTTYNSIFGRVQIDGGSGDSFTVDDAFDSVGRIVHVLQGQVGGLPGDTLFGAGGVLRFTGVTGLGTIKTGTGADFVSVVPNLATPLSLFASSPSTTPGDVLQLALAGVTSPVIGSASVTSGNRAPLNYSGFETVNSDNVAPTVSTDAYAFDVASPSVDFTFSEPVGWAFDASSVTLVNVTTGQAIAASSIVASYDASTRAVHFTFPTLLNRSLPDGNYHATLAAGPADAFGNPLAASVSLDFFVLAGDANHDGTVTFTDLLALAKSYGQGGHTFGQGNFNYSTDGVVDFNDLLILARNYNRVLSAAAADQPPVAVASLSAAATATATTRRRTVDGIVL